MCFGMIVCVVNSIALVCGVYIYRGWGLWLGCVLKGVESKVLVVVENFFACRCKGLWCEV